MSRTTTGLRFKTIFVLGLGRSGSTLLGRLLDNHPDVIGVGELLRLGEVLDNPAARCSCGALASECPEWNALISGVPDSVRRDYRKWTPELLDLVRENARAKVLVDVSKTRGYRLARRWKQADVGFLLLLRDPRGIFRSHSVEGRNDLADRLNLHKKWIKRFSSFAVKAKDRCKVVHYEDMVTSPESTLRGICEFIGLPYDPAVVMPDAKVHHLATYSGSSYMKGAGELRLDERWRQDAMREDLELISKKLRKIAVYRERYKLEEPL